MGVLGGLGYSPKNLRAQLRELKAGLKDPNGPFGVDLALPSTAPTARYVDASSLTYALLTHSTFAARQTTITPTGS